VSKIVLCVDDSATMQTVADITFRGTEFQYVGARTVDEGLQKAKSQKPAVVLADSAMPGKTGYDLCLALKSDPSTADVPVVILVGNGAAYDAAKGTASGADANLPKPWDTQTMLEKVTEIVGKAGQGVAKPGQAGAAAAAAPAAPAAAKPAAAAAAAPGPAAVAAAAAAANAANMPPRSATIMGMPTVKMPAGVAPPAKVPAPAAPAAAATAPGPAPVLRAPAAAATPPTGSTPVIASMGIGGVNRAPMIAGSATKKSALVERTLAKMAARLAEATGLEPGSPELLALLKLSAEVVERVVWEVVPDLAEQIIRENLNDLAAHRRS
jgi:CheY-like chemotaxis protein